MNRRSLIIFFLALIILPLAFFGCKGKVAEQSEVTGAMTPAQEMQAAQIQVAEPAKEVAAETIPPTAAAPQIAEKKAPVSQDMQGRNKDIQKALKNAGFYAGPIDGKIGPKTKKAIQEFQSAKGLKADGKAGPKTWAELEKYLTQ